MSGLVQWTSKAKRKGHKIKAGNKANPHRLRQLASRKRKENERLAKVEAKERKAATAAAVAAANA